MPFPFGLPITTADTVSATVMSWLPAAVEDVQGLNLVSIGSDRHTPASGDERAVYD
ncbi:hypothetical protein [Rhizosaccharibacter radicis]|uniref:Uncharacterized protein n=1 Tax=Rhizosaccharibacter radicis TaxID=2782605 RepID=A0ABT1VVF8_9PROT|nr:hypothetical protein [Acetobacteraceae bacterium KSS12]